ncbi:MAG TPA: class I tRNA ligase family protein [Bacteroidia bacterium]|nr:class I tRNA ligase family protein [Bacteroidia bacterium]
MEYNFKDIEKRWQQRWAKEKTFAAKNDDTSRPKYYVLDMFPYPSGAGLHVGHPLGYIASDIVARYKRHKGFNVLHPMGYDSFGLPAEQYAIQTGQHPKITTEQNIARYREQLDKIGFSFDWDREVRTSDPQYYKWTQWIFIQLFNSWYSKKSNKAEHIDALVKEFEANGNAQVHAVCEETKTFSAADWKAFSEKEKSDLLMNYRIAYLGEAYVNWCPAMGTVLANDEVKDGVSERGGYPVERKLMKQWSMRITAYAQRLLDGLEKIDWPEPLKESQRYWIGRSEGTSLKFIVARHAEPSSASDETLKQVQGDHYIEVFTTRPDTIFGVSFVTLAPEHELVEKITALEYKAKVDAYVIASKSRSERERQADVKKISGEFTGAYVLHPFTGKQIPVYVGDYVLAGYGTGAVMAVPGHDERDHRFAKHFGLPILKVVDGPDVEEQSNDAKEGKCINSDLLNGLEVKDAIKKAIEEIEKKNVGKGKINFRLRDAVFGRQRYWGEPIPIYYKDGIPRALPESELPLLLPEVDKYLPTEDGEPPLARAKDWKYKGQYEYELTTMPGWAGSSWYYLRYEDAHNKNAFADKKQIDYWQNVDLYLGGSEHATGHLLYVRFWTMFLKDMGYLNFDEPAKKLINQGMIQGRSNFVYRLLWGGLMDSGREFVSPNIFLSKEIHEKYLAKDSDIVNQVNTFASSKVPNNGKGLPSPHSSTALHVDVNIVDNDVLDKEAFKKSRIENKNAIFFPENSNYICGFEVEKMSKSKYNVVSPDKICNDFGADTLRLYEMFLGPLELSKPWNTNGITGVHGFLKKLWRLFFSPTGEMSAGQRGQGDANISEEPATKAELKALHRTIKKITEDIERFSFNTSVSNFMICVNELTDLKCNKRAILEPLLIILSPYAPHITEELWEKLGHKESIAFAPFPVFNETYLVEDNFSYPISFNGKMRFNIEMPLTLSVPEIEKIVMEAEQTHKYLEGKTPKKVIIVPKKIVNIVV